jgi:hypothetical protein
MKLGRFQFNQTSNTNTLDRRRAKALIAFFLKYKHQIDFTYFAKKGRGRSLRQAGLRSDALSVDQKITCFVCCCL